MQEIQLLNDKLELLLKKYAVLQTENKRLKDVISDQTKNIENLNGKLSELEQNIVAVQIGNSLPASDEKLKMRTQLDTIIAEIDKILVTLND